MNVLHHHPQPQFSIAPEVVVLIMVLFLLMVSLWVIHVVQTLPWERAVPAPVIAQHSSWQVAPFSG